MVVCGEKWGDNVFMGEFHHSIDEKGRLIIPSKLRDGLGAEFIVTRGIENCLFVYPKDKWEQIIDKLQKLSFTQKNARNFMRFFLSGATVFGVDKQGRVNLTSTLVSYANIKKDCVIVGVADRLEIWSLDEWRCFIDTNSDQMSDIAESLFTESIDL